MNANVKEVHEFKIGTVLVDSDLSVIEMHLELITIDGYRIRLEVEQFGCRCQCKRVE